MLYWAEALVPITLPAIASNRPMSYDLMVFDPEAAPRDRKEFEAWYREQTRWRQVHGSKDPRVCSQALRSWLHEMTQEFPSIDGPYADQVSDDSVLTEYCIGKSVIDSAFGSAHGGRAYDTVFGLAKKHGVGFYDVSDGEGQVWMPDAKGEYVCVHAEPPEPLTPERAARVRAAREEAVAQIMKLLRSDA